MGLLGQGQRKINDKIGDPRLAEVLWGVVGQLTDGDPLNWMLGKVNVGGQVLDSLQEIKDRADKAMSLVEDQANAEIRRLVALAKSKFPFDSIAGELADLDWVKLKGMIDKRLVGFVERLIGQSVEKLSNSELEKRVIPFLKLVG